MSVCCNCRLWHSFWERLWADESRVWRRDRSKLLKSSPSEWFKRSVSYFQNSETLMIRLLEGWMKCELRRGTIGNQIMSCMTWWWWITLMLSNKQQRASKKETEVISTAEDEYWLNLSVTSVTRLQIRHSGKSDAFNYSIKTRTEQYWNV